MAEMSDVRGLLQDHFEVAVKHVEDVSLLEVGVVLVGVGTVMAIWHGWKKWRKQRGYRMVLRERDKKIHDLLVQIINDGLFEAEVRGEISAQEMNRLYQEISDKLDLADLVPKKRRAQIVKTQIKARLANGIYKEKPNVPGGPPTPIVREKFAEKMGEFATKFWRNKAA